MSTGWRKLTRKDLRTFDEDMTKAILYAMDCGGVGRVSNNGHAILRNNTGQTMSVSRSASGGSRKQNVARDLCRVFGAPVEDSKPSSDDSTAVTPPDLRQPVGPHPAEQADEPKLPCPANGCDETFVTEGARYSHANTQHHVCPEPGCGFASMKPNGVGAHRSRKHGYESTAPHKIRERERARQRRNDVTSPQPTPAAAVNGSATTTNRQPAQSVGHISAQQYAAGVDAANIVNEIRKLLGEDVRVARLQQQVDRLTRERDDARTQLALVKEALHL